MSDAPLVRIIVSGPLALALDRLATKLGRPAEHVALDAISSFVDEELAFLDSLDEAEAQIERGEYYTQEQMEQWFEARRTVDRAA